MNLFFSSNKCVGIIFHSEVFENPQEMFSHSIKMCPSFQKNVLVQFSHHVINFHWPFSPSSLKFPQEKSSIIFDLLQLWSLHVWTFLVNIDNILLLFPLPYRLFVVCHNSCLPFSLSSISSDLISHPTNFSTSRALALDYSPMLRDICRSEKMRCESGRRTTTNNRGHYLRFLIAQNSFGNDYFNEQCEIFRRQ